MKIFRLLSMPLVICFIISVSIGCKSNSSDDSDSGYSDIDSGTINDPGVYVYVPEIISIPTPDEHIVNFITVFNDKVFFTTGEENLIDDVVMYTSMWSMSFDGLDLIEIPNYYPKVHVRFQGGHVQVVAMYIDNNSNMWIIEVGNYFSWGDKIVYFFVPTLRKLDASGTEIFSVDINRIFESRNERDPLDSISFVVDNDGNAYINILGNICIVDPNGDFLFSLELQGERSTQLIKLNDGSIVGFGRQGNSQIIRQIDIHDKAWGTTIEMPPLNIKSVLSGNDNHILVFNDGASLYGIKTLESEPEQILSWTDIGLNADGIKNISFLQNDSLFILNQEFKFGVRKLVTEVIIIERISIEDLPEKMEKTVLTLATFRFEGHLLNAVQYFNRRSDTHTIQIIDYSIYNTHDDHMAGLTRLNTEIIAGRVPDILDLSDVPFEVYAARGLFVDLNPFLDADTELNRSGLMDNVLRASEINGSLYGIFPVFKISTMYGIPAAVGADPGWNLTELKMVLEANPQADLSIGSRFGAYVSREEMLKLLFQHNIEQFVDWDSGTASFETDYFLEILEFANIFPTEHSISVPSKYEYFEIISRGRQIINIFDMGSFRSYIGGRSDFGGELVLKGFPVKNGSGNRFVLEGGVAITIGCEDANGAWKFIRTLLTESFQREFVWNDMFSVNRAIFDEGRAWAMDPANAGRTRISWDPEISILYPELSQDEADKIVAFIDSVTSVLPHDEMLWNIIIESASDYFNGQRSAEDAARIIQSRASRYLAEQR